MIDREFDKIEKHFKEMGYNILSIERKYKIKNNEIIEVWKIEVVKE